jgi:hypothetical protein
VFPWLSIPQFPLQLFILRFFIPPFFESPFHPFILHFSPFLSLVPSLLRLFIGDVSLFATLFFVTTFNVVTGITSTSHAYAASDYRR